MAAQLPKVLIVDQDPEMLRQHTRWLEAAGFEVRQAGNGDQAQDAIEAECPDFLITDWDLAGATGLELVQWVRENHLPHYIYTLFLTTHGDSRDMVQALESGADDYMRKPASREELLARLQSGARVLESVYTVPIARIVRDDRLGFLQTDQ